MESQPQVLILGGTGRTGGRVLTHLLGRGVPVRALVRSADRLPTGIADDPLLTVVEVELLALSTDQLAHHVEGCTAVISCLGHTISVRGIFGPPRDLVEQAVRRVRAAVEASRPTQPVRLILMTSVSVNQPGHADTRRGRGERACLWLLRGLVPPTRDNQRAADFLTREVGLGDATLEWVVVRPDTLRDGDEREYRLSSELVTSLFRPNSTRMTQIAHFMGELVTDDATWARWRGRLPVIIDEPARPPF
jgi:nucleoside-diphosphate-sugar epimerase